ncbi:MAG: GSCFA domain-containing protein [Mediterranea sp.]|jgi:hypothetical protein|nr:GSCFA domain-containing protein [Mediterranea sp.]
MNFVTPVEISDRLPRLTQHNELLVMGSCFAENIGSRLAEAKFRCDVNPYGVLYNPLSIAQALREILAGKVYTPDDLLQHGGLWHSAMHHGDFSSESTEEILQRINMRLGQAHRQSNRWDVLLLTFGTAWVYLQEDKVVGNCHKQPEKCFVRRRLEPEEIVTGYTGLIAELMRRHPHLKIVFTVSPIRHVRDGMHANNLSKAVLHLAIDRLQAAYPDAVSYFPAYELLLDELRDYRFYAADMLHPSEVAVQYVWQKFVQHCFSPQAVIIMNECEEIHRALAHRPFRPASDEYKRFLGQIMLRIDRLSEKYPYLDFQNERDVCHTLLIQ